MFHDMCPEAKDQIYSNTRVPIQVSTSQHESARVNTNQHQSKMSQHESDTSQHESKAGLDKILFKT